MLWYDEHAVECILSLFKNLNELVIFGSQLCDKYLCTIYNRFPKQTELQLTDTTATDDKLIRVIYQCRYLQKVHLSDTRINANAPYTQNTITGVSIIRLIDACPELTELSIGFRHNINDSVAQRIAACSMFLQMLDISKTSITGAGIVIILNNCQELHTLLINSISNINFNVSLTNKMMYLTHLEACSTDINITTLTMLATAFPFMNHIKLMNCSNVKQSDLTKLSELWHRLNYIDLSGSTHNTGAVSFDDGLRAVLFTNKCVNTLILKHRVSNTFLHILGYSACCGDLLKLDVSHCSQIQDGGIEFLSKKCHKLKYLNLCFCSKILSGLGS